MVREPRTPWGGKPPRRPDIYAVAILGEFADAASFEGILPEWVDAAVARWHSRELAGQARGVALRIGLDVGRSGDPSALALLRGGHVESIEQARIPDISLVVEWAAERLRALNVRRADLEPALRPGVAATVVVDCNGIGAGAHDTLAARGWPVECFFSQGAPRAYAYDDEGAPVDTRRFVNRRASAGWDLREAFRTGAIAIPPDPALRAEILAHYFIARLDKRLILPEKGTLRARLGRSPNAWDAIMMALAAGDDACSIGGSAVSF